MKHELLVLIVVFTYLPVSTSARMNGGTGVLLDVTSNKPIPGAIIRLECNQQELRVRKIKEVLVTTDSQGRFSFGSEQLSDCDFAYLRAEKGGYIETKTVDVRYMNTDYENLPQKIYMTPSASSRIQHLQFLSTLASGTNASKKYEYLNVYNQFFASKNIAETTEETQYVYGQYCKRLLTLYSSLTDSEKAWLEQNTVQYVWNNRVNTGKVDHRKEVGGSCKSP